ncbi:hypothetical protein HZH66_009325 [Vespula vulgaris]|uniref:Uncharacterized protein n=1 Tax=Vespula vulgaris TaxID=7454 RepID=A0A834N028_VESVU|nr:hypothetical protein HZH66_009325 [Vespula vulgaris]
MDLKMADVALLTVTSLLYTILKAASWLVGWLVGWLPYLTVEKYSRTNEQALGTLASSTIVTPALHTLELDNAWVKRYYVRIQRGRVMRTRRRVKAKINQCNIITSHRNRRVPTSESIKGATICVRRERFYFSTW